MKEELISFNTAKLAKEKGFNIPLKIGYEEGSEEKVYSQITVYFNNGPQYAAPTQSLLQRWLREEKYIILFIVPALKENHYEWLIRYDLNGEEEEILANEAFAIYEDALEAGLQEALKLI